MDISTVVATERTIDIKHPVSGEPIGLKVTLRPDTDPSVVTARRRFLNERLTRRGKVTAEKIEQQQHQVIVAAVAGWNWQGEITFEGSVPDFNEVNLLKVLKKLPWVRDQIDEELGDAAAFFQNSATS